MKRLILSSLLSCMVVGQVSADEGNGLVKNFLNPMFEMFSGPTQVLCALAEKLPSSLLNTWGGGVCGFFLPAFTETMLNKAAVEWGCKVRPWMHVVGPVLGLIGGGCFTAQMAKKVKDGNPDQHQAREDEFGFAFGMGFTSMNAIATIMALPGK